MEKTEESSEETELNNPLWYCGEYFDEELECIYLRARYYDPIIGRFISEDSFPWRVNDQLSLNLYTYCTNNPIMFIDPSGHEHIVSSYRFIRTYQKEYGYGVKGDGYILKPVYATINKHVFTNINLTVYENYDTSINSKLNDNWRHYNLDPIKAYSGEKQAFIENGSEYKKGSIADLTLLDIEHEYDKVWNWTKVGVSAVWDISTVVKSAKILKDLDKVPSLAERAWNSVKGAISPSGGTAVIVIGDTAMGQLPKDKQKTIKWLAGLLPIYGTYQTIVDATSDEPIKGVFVNDK